MNANGRHGHMSNRTMDGIKDEMLNGEMFDADVPEVVGLSILGGLLPIYHERKDKEGNVTESIRFYVELDPKVFLRKEKLWATIDALRDKGYPVSVYKKSKEQGGF